MSGIGAAASRPTIDIGTVARAAFKSGMSTEDMKKQFESRGYKVRMSSNALSPADGVAQPPIVVPEREPRSTGRKTASKPSGIAAYIGTALESAGRMAVEGMQATRGKPT